MEQQKYEVGDSVEMRCETCDAVRQQMVASIGVKNQITRVNCPRCGTLNRFRKLAFGADKINSNGADQAKPYDPAQNYQKGEIIEHPSFGFGEVVNIIDFNKIEVLFNDRLRCMVQGRSV